MTTASGPVEDVIAALADPTRRMLLERLSVHGEATATELMAGQVYIDRRASPEIRAQAQGLFVLATYGIGQGLGTLAAGWVYNAIMQGQSGVSALPEWHFFWLIPLVFAMIVTLVFVAGFRDTTKPAEARAA